MGEATTNKEAFFKELEKLDELTDDETGDDFSRLITSSKKSAAEDTDSTASFVPTSSSSSAGLNLSHTNTVPESSSRSETSSKTDEMVSATERPLPLKSAKTTGAPEKSKPEGPPCKRRRTYAARTVPEHQQVFKGLVFFFFPNSDVSPVRRLRIQRAQEYGAFWARSWGENITHVIVDKGLKYQDILCHLKLGTFPDTIALVDEGYPAECIKFRCVLNPAQSRFRINGAPTPSVVEEPSVEVVESSTGSLPLKPPKGQQQYTPTESEQMSNGQDRYQPVQEQQIEPEPVSTHEEASPEGLARERDALDDIIEETKATKDLPLDELDPGEENKAATCEADSSEASVSEAEERRKSYPVTEKWQERFACMQKHEENSDFKSPNSRTIEVLQQMLDYYERTADHWRVIAYRKAISALRRQPKRVVTRTQARAITGIGPRLADKIEEIVFTNRLRRLENANCSSEDMILQKFLGVYGAGISQASRWVAQGYKTLEDLKMKASLTKSQRIGVDHYDDFAQRIPRKEIEAHGAVVRDAIHRADPNMQAIIGGSYRRGASNSGDIDVLITKPDASIEQIRTLMLEVVVPDLFQQGFLQASLASTSRGDGFKWHGASALPGSSIWRRIDLLFVPGSEIGAALIYFTGNDIFNRSMRLLASKKGMRLNQRGLYADVLRGEQRKKLTEGRLVEGRDEKRIFELLGVPWRPPEHRIC